MQPVATVHVYLSLKLHNVSLLMSNKFQKLLLIINTWLNYHGLSYVLLAAYTIISVSSLTASAQEDNCNTYILIDLTVNSAMLKSLLN